MVNVLSRHQRYHEEGLTQKIGIVVLSMVAPSVATMLKYELNYFTTLVPLCVDSHQLSIRYYYLRAECVLCVEKICTKRRRQGAN